MRWDVEKLQSYYQAPLGRYCAHFLKKKIFRLWPAIKGEDVLGVGFPLPYLRYYLGQAHRVVVAMPASQGAMPWGDFGGGVSQKKNLVALTLNDALPFPDQSFHKILLMHHLEFCENPCTVLRECWRILKPEGELLICVPQKYRLWDLFGDTPFSQGASFSETTLKKYLYAGLFSIDSEDGALFFPPFLTQHLPVKRFLPFIEKKMPPLLSPLGGVLLIKARKQLTLPRKVYRKETCEHLAGCSS